MVLSRSVRRCFSRFDSREFLTAMNRWDAQFAGSLFRIGVAVDGRVSSRGARSCRWAKPVVHGARFRDREPVLASSGPGIFKLGHAALSQRYFAAL